MRIRKRTRSQRAQSLETSRMLDYLMIVAFVVVTVVAVAMAVLGPEFFRTAFTPHRVAGK
jgi:hypothetical protein